MQKIPTTIWQFLYFGVYPKRWFFVVAALGITLMAVLQQATPYIFKLVVDAVERGDMASIPYYVALYPLVFLIIQIIHRGSSLLIEQVCIVGKEYLYNQITSHLFFHSHRYFADRMAGAVVAKVSTAANIFSDFIYLLLWNYLDAAITMVATVVFIALVSPFTALIFAGVFICIFVLNYAMSRQSQVYASASADAQSKQTGVIVDIVTNTSTVRQFGRVKVEQQAVADVSRQARDSEFRVFYYGEWMLVLNGVIITAGFAWMIKHLLGEYEMNLVGAGDLVFVLGLLMSVAYQLLYLGTIFQRSSRQFGELKDSIKELLVPHDVKDVPGAKPLVVKNGNVVMSQVSFTYTNNTILQNFSLTIPAGERVGLVGPSGAGKTTLVSLLLRQYNLDKGVITIDDQDISTVTQESLRQAIAVVPQETTLFHRTIRENIAYGKPDATDEEIVAVAKKARVHEFVVNLAEGYQTLVGERGVKLSGGQKQRIAIARAMLKNAPIMILDEATSALDSESEIAIQNALHNLMMGKTVIAIAHRLSTLREMDRIIVIENGCITEDGTHDALLAYDGTYASLWRHQSGGFF